jgi:hypothetical protein
LSLLTLLPNSSPSWKNQRNEYVLVTLILLQAKLTVEQLEQDELRRLADVEGLADKVEESEHSIATLREEKYQLQARLNTEEEEKIQYKALNLQLVHDNTGLQKVFIRTWTLW